MKLKRNINSKKYFLCGLIMVVVLTVTVNFIGSKANYRMTASIPLTEGKVVSSPYDINIVALYLDNVEQDVNTIIPSGYRINENKSYCYKGANKNNKDVDVKLYTDEMGNHTFSGISKSSKCILYLEKLNDNCGVACQYVLSNISNINIRRNDYLPFDKAVTSDNSPIDKTVYVAPDDDGTSYYYAGEPLDNWVEFGGYYWRIIRINGDGTIRLIYYGEVNDGLMHSTGIISQFNSNNDDNKYVGYFYEQHKVHGIETPSLLYNALNSWFSSSNIRQGTSFFDKIDVNAGFCGDRQPSSGTEYIDGLGGIDIINTVYAANVRLAYGKIKSPTLKCQVNDDLYTYKNSNKGNRVLENPVGLITADEASYAGLVYGNNDTRIENNYLYSGGHYWTMTPFSAVASHVFIVNNTGEIVYGNTVHSWGIYPVINLRSDVTLTGDGTINNPFKVNLV
ncbi:MAG: hypothetical protein NC483_00375 [Ruminococcus sp.]|nr:hypothetical protein [Ruminococcus sp.]